MLGPDKDSQGQRRASTKTLARGIRRRRNVSLGKGPGGRAASEVKRGPDRQVSGHLGH